jgi:DNA-binding NarL/FixJ family response regulator
VRGRDRVGHSDAAADPDPELRLVVADHHEATRTGIWLALGSRGFAVAAEAVDADGVAGAVLREHPDECLIATGLPGGGIRAATILILAVATADQTVIDAVRAGACGYLPKDTPPEELIGAIEAAARGQPSLSADVTAVVLDHVRSHPDHPHAADTEADLSWRELEVLALLVESKENIETAQALSISPKQ